MNCSGESVTATATVTISHAHTGTRPSAWMTGRPSGMQPAKSLYQPPDLRAALADNADTDATVTPFKPRGQHQRDGRSSGKKGKGGKQGTPASVKPKFDPHSAAVTPRILTKKPIADAIVTPLPADSQQSQPLQPSIVAPSVTESSPKTIIAVTRSQHNKTPPVSVTAPLPLAHSLSAAKSDVMGVNHSVNHSVVGPIKLFSPTMKMVNIEAIERHMSHSQYFTVVSAIGPANAGKSTLLNGAVQSDRGFHCHHTSAAMLHSHGHAHGQKPHSSGTTGVDVMATPEHVIALDCQRLPAAGTDTDRDLHATVSMMALSHLVLLVTEWPIATDTIAAVKQSLSLYRSLYTRLKRPLSLPELVVVVNKVKDSTIATITPTSMQCTVDELFSECEFVKRGTVSNVQPRGGSHVSLFVVPFNDPISVSLFASSIRDLRRQLLAVEPLSVPLTGSEKDWLRLAQSVSMTLQSSKLTDKRHGVGGKGAGQYVPNVRGQGGHRGGRGSSGPVEDVTVYQRDRPARSVLDLYQPP